MIKGTNLGNWLVLEKWTQPSFFDGTDAEDEIWLNRRLLKKAQKYTPVIVGEWCLSNRMATKALEKGDDDAAREAYRAVADLQLEAWGKTAGFFHWNYQLLRDRKEPFSTIWSNGWDLARCWESGWMPERV